MNILSICSGWPISVHIHWWDEHSKFVFWLTRFHSDPVKRATTPSRRTTKLERYRQERAAAAAGVVRGLDVATDDFYVLIEVEELKYQLEVSASNFFVNIQNNSGNYGAAPLVRDQRKN